MSDDIVNDFVTLFRGRADAYGSWEGGCVKQPLTQAVFRDHLSGEQHIGVYPSVPSGDTPMCVWGCTDIDYDSYEDADLLRRTYESVDVTAWVEKTRKGWHVWVFADRLVPSRDMRNMQLAAHQVCGLNPKEVNPKQVNVTLHTFGNYVRLPYPGGLDQRYMVDTRGERISLEAFTAAAVESRSTPEKISFLAQHYREPVAARIDVSAPTADMTAAASMLTPLGRMMWRSGPIEGRDRSTTLQHLAHECRKAHLAPQDALLLVKDADQRWGKYSTRGEPGEQELLKLVQRAYGPTAGT